MAKVSIKPWHINGDFFDSCNCEVNCPCVFGSPANYDTCDVAMAWHVNKGYYGDTTLDDLNFAIVCRTHRLMSKGDWTVAIYIDERGTEEQREALRLIASGEAGASFARHRDLTGTLLGIKYVPIRFEIAGRTRRIKIPSILEMEVEPVKGARPNEEVKLVNDPAATQRGFTPYILARAAVHRFSDYD